MAQLRELFACPYVVVITYKVQVGDVSENWVMEAVSGLEE
jgi:hypothetical protein